MGKSEPVSQGGIIESYNKMNTEFDAMLSERTSGEVAYDNIVLDELNNGKSIREALDIAAEKYPEEALQYDDDTIDEIYQHYDYLLNHIKIKNQLEQLSK